MTIEEIDRLTIAEVRAIYERASAAMEQLRALGLMPPISVKVPVLGFPQMRPGSTILNGQPFPCLACGRVAPERPGELLQALECQTCGNHLPGTMPLTNKGEIQWSPEELARKRSLPAFDKNGNPTAEE